MIFKAAEDTHVHHHGTSDIKFGRGAVLTVDLTNRCNMMCNPCFMDANQVGYVHEPTFEDTRAIFDRAVSFFKPRRQIIILFSGGEPTIAPHFLESVAYAKKIGFYRILAATNGISVSPRTWSFARLPRLPVSMAFTCNLMAYPRRKTNIGVSGICLM